MEYSSIGKPALKLNSNVSQSYVFLQVIPFRATFEKILLEFTILLEDKQNLKFGGVITLFL